MKSQTITTEQLIALVTQKTEHLNINDGRVADTITERTVRYYVTIGVVRPPLRDGNTSVWTTDHVNDLIRVRRSQYNGEPLKAVRRMLEMDLRQPSRGDSWKAENNAALRFPILRSTTLNMGDLQVNFPSISREQPHTNGWMVRLSPLLHLSGFGAQPSSEEIDKVRIALHDRIEADMNENQIINNPINEQDNQ
jgi:DNA-binding transcriptional MerR regulator